ncbi:MAG TPA: ABC transporter permease subunit/CPBP intramembrane protease [Lacipirellulaceae bacterium]|nr:ABC transporter permease subunit/CPBP intramembrane protease [Lacipirellulaceae bacterium]
MQLKNVKLIYLREMRDQLRDRRTLFLIAVLPLLLYPLLGMSFFQVAQFLQHHAAKVLVLGDEELSEVDWLPPLFVGGQFAAELFDDVVQAENLQVVRAGDLPQAGITGTAAEIEAAARRALDEGLVEAVLIFPPGFDERLRDVRRALIQREAVAESELPAPGILYNAANEKSQLAQLRTAQVMRRWSGAVTERNLAASEVPMEATRPFEVQLRDVAQDRQRQTALWSKVLPFVLFIWALTGAFYPAVDLCAGEKERGTLETLLTSPALRREIVWGKLFTVMTFSAVTALLNLTSLGITGKFVIDQLSHVFASDMTAVSMPPASALVWLALGLIPISALFSALCLACAAYARSTKEGQYYLMPLMLVSMPLMLLPMSPGVELNLGNALVPLTGMVLLLRSVIEGNYPMTLQFFGMVAAVGTVTLLCCLLAIRWAEEQFNRESVLFRESERLDLRRWLVHVVRDRGDTPSFAQAALCVALILIVQFFVSVAMTAQAPAELTFPFLAKMLLISQLACIFAPAAIMTVMLTRNPLRTLQLERRPGWAMLVGAVALAVVMHPIVVRLAEGIARIYPMSEQTGSSVQAIQAALGGAPRWWMVVALIGVLPAVCEEIAFRGFVLSGFRRLGHKWWAIGLSAVAFGAVHLFLQQKIAASAAGLVIGYLAIQTGSLWPCIVYHAAHNSLPTLLQQLASAAGPESMDARWLWGDEPPIYQNSVVAACAFLAAGILWWLHTLSYRRTPEEQLEEARQRQDGTLAVGA